MALQRTCQHRLRHESDRCRHGLYMGTTCSTCIRECAYCWDLHAGADTYCARPAEPAEARVVYERHDAFDLQSGPYGYQRVGFTIGNRVFWVGCIGSGMPAGDYGADEQLATDLVAAWNRYARQEGR